MCYQVDVGFVGFFFTGWIAVLQVLWSAVEMTEVETVRGGTPHLENGTNINNIMDEQDDFEDDLESNSAKLFERSRIKALAGLHITVSFEFNKMC